MSTREDGLEEAARLLDGWAEADEAGHGDGDDADVLRGAAAAIRCLKRPDQTAKCICTTSCPNRVAAWSRSGLCLPCATGDCECETGFEDDVTARRPQGKEGGR